MSWVFFEAFIKSLMHPVDFKAVDSTTRLEWSALHFSVLGGGIAKHLARFSPTTASSRSPATTIPRLPRPTSLSTRPNRTLTRPVAMSQDQNKLSILNYAAGLGHVHLIDFLCTRFPDILTQRVGCGRSPLHVAVVMNYALE